jgi:hypothetical protein
MESLYQNLSEKEFSRGSKTLLWIFASLFLFAGLYVLFVSLVLKQLSIPAILSLAPFGISLIVFIIAAFATFKGKDMFFSVNMEKIEYRIGGIKASTHLFLWNDIKEIVMPKRQKKIKLLFKDGTTSVINLTWIQGEKTSIIRKHVFHIAREKDLPVKKVSTI